MSIARMSCEQQNLQSYILRTYLLWYAAIPSLCIPPFLNVFAMNYEHLSKNISLPGLATSRVAAVKTAWTTPCEL